MKRFHYSDNVPILSPERLRGGSVFAAMSTNAISFLLRNGNLYQVNEHEFIFDYGDRGDSFFVVLDGEIDFYPKELGDYIYTRTARFGQDIGYVGMIALIDRAGKAKARKKSLLLEISANLYSEFHDQFPFDFGIISLNLSRNIARLVGHLNESLAQCYFNRWPLK